MLCALAATLTTRTYFFAYLPKLPFYLAERSGWIEFARRRVELRKIQPSAESIGDFDGLFLAYVFVGYGTETSGELARSSGRGRKQFQSGTS